MIRAGLLALALAGPASAATTDACRALVERLPVEVGRVAGLTGSCLFLDVTVGKGDALWRADAVTLAGDVDALPDALPQRLSLAAAGIARGSEATDRPALAWLLRQRDYPGLSLRLRARVREGALVVDTFRLRFGEVGRIEGSARIVAPPQTFPFEPPALLATRLAEAEAEIAFDGLFERYWLEPLGRLLLDLDADPGPQVIALRDRALAFLDRFEDGQLAASAEAAGRLVDALPNPRGTLRLATTGEGVAALELAAPLLGRPSAETLATLVERLGLSVAWEPGPR